MSVSPLALFELRHPGANLGKLIQGFGFSGWQGLGLNDLWFIPQSLSRLLFPITNLDGDLLRFYTWCKGISDVRVNSQPWWAIGLTILLLSTPFFSGKFTKLPIPGNSVLRIVILSGVGGILLFKLMGGNLYDFYLAVLYPVVLILAARSIDFIWRKWGKFVAVTALLVIVGLNLLVVARAYHPQGLAAKRDAVAWTASELGGKDFELDSLSGCSRYNGVRYLFFLENMEPVKSFVDQDLSWLYPDGNKRVSLEYLVTFVTPYNLKENDRQRYNYLISQTQTIQRFGDLEVLITKN